MPFRQPLERLEELREALASAVEKLPDSDNSLWRDLLWAAVAYSQLRCEWALASGEDRAEKDERRTRAHDTFIDACNVISRRCGLLGIDQKWRLDIGDAASLEGRKRLGDFACYLSLDLALKAR